MQNIQTLGDINNWVGSFSNYMDDLVNESNIVDYSNYMSDAKMYNDDVEYIVNYGDTLCNESRCKLCRDFSYFFTNAFKDISKCISQNDKIKISMLEDFKCIFSQWLVQGRFTAHNTCECQFSVLFPIPSSKTNLNYDIFLFTEFKARTYLTPCYTDPLVLDIQNIYFCTLKDLSVCYDDVDYYDSDDSDDNNTALTN